VPSLFNSIESVLEALWSLECSWSERCCDQYPLSYFSLLISLPSCFLSCFGLLDSLCRARFIIRVWNVAVTPRLLMIEWKVDLRALSYAGVEVTSSYTTSKHFLIIESIISVPARHWASWLTRHHSVWADRRLLSGRSCDFPAHFVRPWRRSRELGKGRQGQGSSLSLSLIISRVKKAHSQCSKY